jgi:hypothetical protein
MAGNYDFSSAIVAPPMGHPSNSSGSGFFADIPADVRGWNWGAFLLGWIWGIKNRTWVALWTFVPIVGIPGDVHPRSAWERVGLAEPSVAKRRTVQADPASLELVRPDRHPSGSGSLDRPSVRRGIQLAPAGGS